MTTVFAEEEPAQFQDDEDEEGEMFLLAPVNHVTILLSCVIFFCVLLQSGEKKSVLFHTTQMIQPPQITVVDRTRLMLKSSFDLTDITYIANTVATC